MEAGRRVQIRVAALLIQDEHVLVVYQNKDGRMAWMLPGGAADFGETFTEALSRELTEEFDHEFTVGPPLAFVESISPDLNAYPVHMLHVIVACTTNVPLDASTLRVLDENTREVRLADASELEQLDLRPAIVPFLQDCLRGIPDGVRYLGIRW